MWLLWIFVLSHISAVLEVKNANLKERMQYLKGKFNIASRQCFLQLDEYNLAEGVHGCTLC